MTDHEIWQTVGRAVFGAILLIALLYNILKRGK
jgi:hypothetical protein